MAYLWDPHAILLSRRVGKLSANEECWYRRALDYSWIDDGLPADPTDAADRIGKKCTPTAAAKLIEIFFTPHPKDPQKVVNEVQEERRKKLQQKLRKLSKAGKESARKRKATGNLPPQKRGNKCSTNDEQMLGNKCNVINTTTNVVVEREEAAVAANPPTLEPIIVVHEHPAVVIYQEKFGVNVSNAFAKEVAEHVKDLNIWTLLITKKIAFAAGPLAERQKIARWFLTAYFEEVEKANGTTKQSYREQRESAARESLDRESAVRQRVRERDQQLSRPALPDSRGQLQLVESNADRHGEGDTLRGVGTGTDG